MSTEDDRKFDIRTIDRRMDAGEIDRDAYQEHLDNLEDVSDNAVEMEAEFEVGVLDEDEDEEELEEVEADEEEDDEQEDE